MKRRVRGAWRLARVALHVLHGLAIVLLRFPAFDPPARRARVQWWAARTLLLLGVRHEAAGTPRREGGTLLAVNHVSWLDIVAIHALLPQARFVSKSDVKRWPLLNRLVDAADTLYLERERPRDALRMVHRMGEALAAGDMVAVFPEGTTGAGAVPLPFHANLLQAAIATGAKVQPVALRFSDAAGPFSAAVAYLGDTTLLESLWRVACADGLEVHLRFLAPLDAAGRERRALAEELRARIAAALTPFPSGRGFEEAQASA